MNPRNTSTGAVLENMIIPALLRGGYQAQKQVVIGTRIGGRRHRIDVLAIDNAENKYIISMKWQQFSGTAEQKVPFEILSLAQANLENQYKGVYLILAGTGWTLRDYFQSDEFKELMPAANKIKIISLEEFVSLANEGQL